MIDAEGRKIGDVSVEKLSLPKKPSRLGSKEGIDKVLPPWTPIEIGWRGGILIVKPWGRFYQFEGPPSLFKLKRKALLLEG